MLTTIAFFVALLFTCFTIYFIILHIGAIFDNSAETIEHIEWTGRNALVLAILCCGIWSWLYYLSH